MKTVFISSVVNDFEEFRQAARKAVELMGDRPVMCEDFGARPYASDLACIAEVESSDVYIVILGDKYGYVTPAGISVTQSEFRAAKATGRPVLAFVQDCAMEDSQATFRKEVEDYATGLFRGSFKDTESLKDAIIKSLRMLSQMQQAISEECFQKKIDEAISTVSGYSRGRNPLLTIGFLPQPSRAIDIVEIEGKLDGIFTRVCAHHLAIMREGYEPQVQRDWTGIKSGSTLISFFADGLILILLSPIDQRDDYFSSSFAPPSRIKNLAIGAFSLLEASGCWASIKLSGMDHIMVKELPEGKVSSITMRSYGDTEAGFNKLFIPVTETSYKSWVEQCGKRFQRIFAN